MKYKFPSFFIGMSEDWKPSELSCPEEVEDFGYYFDDNGERVFGVVGKHNCYQDIQRDLSSCDYSQLKAFLLASCIEDRGVYGVRPDVLNDVNDLSAYLSRVDELYSRLPDEIKAKYKNAYEVANGFSEKDFELLKNPPASSSDSKEVQNDGQ